MAYSKSIITLRDDDLFNVEIVSTSWFGLFENTSHATFRTTEECQDWLIKQRCKHLEINDKTKEQEATTLKLSKK